MAYIYTGQERIRLLSRMLYNMALSSGHANMAWKGEKRALCGADKVSRFIKLNPNLGPDQKRRYARAVYLLKLSNTMLSICLIFYKSGLNVLASKRVDLVEANRKGVLGICIKAGLHNCDDVGLNSAEMVRRYELAMDAYTKFYRKRFGLVIAGGEVAQERYYSANLARYEAILKWVVDKIGDRVPAGKRASLEPPARQIEYSAAALEASPPS